MIKLSRNKNICCGLKKVVEKSRARVYFEQQILALLLVFHQTHNLSRNKFARDYSRDLENQPISAPHFFNPQQMFLLRFKLITPGEKRETSKKTCNETMLRDKLRVFVSRISPPYELYMIVWMVGRSKNVHILHLRMKESDTFQILFTEREAVFLIGTLRIYDGDGEDDA